MNTVHLWQALKDGAQIEDSSLGTITLHQRQLGELVVSTGQVVACDPLVYPDTKPFHVMIPPGRYPVLAIVASFSKNNDRRIAYVLLRLGTQEPVRWELATQAGQDISSLEDGQFFGYAVDAGIACFMDIDAAAGLPFPSRFECDTQSIYRRQCHHVRFRLGRWLLCFLLGL